MRIWLDPQRMAAHALTTQDIERSVRGANVEIPGGCVEGTGREFAVRTRGGETLTIHFDPEKKGFGEVYLEGDTSWSCDGKIFREAYRY